MKFAVGALSTVALLLVAPPFASGSFEEKIEAALECSESAEVTDGELEGKACGEIIIPPAGTEIVEAGGGDDIIVATEDVETINAGSGNDTIVGTSKVETISAGEGNDVVYGESLPPGIESSLTAALEDPRAVPVLSEIDDRCSDGNSENEGIALGTGNDFCIGGDGNQIIYGNDGNDSIWGGRGNDQIYGQNGNDLLFGSVGDDLIVGGPHNDRLSGGNGSDNILGGDGNDYVHGDTVGDVRRYPDVSAAQAGLSGGAGKDTLSFAMAVTPGFEENRSPYVPWLGGPWPELTSFVGFDSSIQRGVYVDLAGWMDLDGDGVPGELEADNGSNPDGGGKDTIANDFENVVGSAFTDVIVGNDLDNTIWGGGGADIILGQGGSDSLYGGMNGDYLDGGTGDADALNGGTTSNAAADSATHDQCVNGDSTPECENLTATPRRITPPATDKIRVGLMNTASVGTIAGMDTGTTTGMNVFLVGSEAADKVTAQYEPATNIYGGKGAVLFKSLGATQFNFAVAIQSGCFRPSGTDDVRCPLAPPNKNAEDFTPTLLMSGGVGWDELQTHNLAYFPAANFHPATTKVIIGGDGNDTLTGDSSTEDIIIDGLHSDTIQGYGQSDAIYQGQGGDSIYGGDGGDVLSAAEICAGDTMNGGSGNDNITWAPISIEPAKSMTPGVAADLATDTAGRNTSGGSANCGGGPLDQIPGVEHLEGSGGWDKLVGDEGNNTLLGRAGEDDLYGGAGTDLLHTHSDDYDGVINCGSNPAGADNRDTLVRDFLREDERDPDPPSGTCEIINEDDPEYTYAVDRNIIQRSANLAALFRLGERHGSKAYGGANPDPISLVGSYSGSVAKERSGSVPYTEDTSVLLGSGALPSEGGRLDLGDPLVSGSRIFDPASYPSTGYTVEIWVNLPADSPSVGTRFVLSKIGANGSGVSLYRNSFGNLVFGSTDTGGTSREVTGPTLSTNNHWYQVVGTLSGNTVNMYVDGTTYSQSFSQSVIPSAPSGGSFVLGMGPGAAGGFGACFDTFAIYGRALIPTEINNHRGALRSGAISSTDIC